MHASTVPTTPHDGARTRHLRVLIVDDNADSADTLAILIELLGAEVRVTRDGPAALAALDAFHPSAVLLDIGMPGMDGYEVARRIRSRPGFESVTLIALTGWSLDEDRRRTQASGFDHHLVKPVDMDVLGTLLSCL